MICTACGMTGHRASTCPLELWRRAETEIPVSEPVVLYDIERMNKALEGPFVIMPTNIRTREEIEEWMNGGRGETIQ